MNRPLRVAWITFFPVEWLPEAPEEIRRLHKAHPASWQRVLLRELQKDPSIELHVFVIRKSFERDVVFTSGNATFYCLKAPGSLRAPSLFWVDTWLLQPHIRRIQPDVIHAWGMEQAAGLVAQRLKRPFLVTMQGVFSWLKDRVQLNRYERLMAFLEGRLFSKRQNITVEAAFAVGFLKSRWPNLKIAQVEHAPDPIFAAKNRRCNPRKLRFLNMGGANLLKGADLLYRSLAQFQNVDFELVSIGGNKTPLMESLRKELPEWLFARVQLREGLSPEEVCEEMSCASMMIYPTRGDTSPNSVKEAVTHGLPVVATRVGGISDYLVDGENGILCEPDSLGSLTEGIRRALQNSDFLQGRVKAETLAKVREQLCAPRMARNFLDLYRSITHEPSHEE